MTSIIFSLGQEAKQSEAVMAGYVRGPSTRKHLRFRAVVWL